MINTFLFNVANKAWNGVHIHIQPSELLLVTLRGKIQRAKIIYPLAIHRDFEDSLHILNTSLVRKSQFSLFFSRTFSYNHDAILYRQGEA